MIKTAIPSSENNFRYAFPSAAGVIKNLQVREGRVSFELCFYASENAYNELNNPSEGVPMPSENGVIKREHFSEDSKVIEEYEPETGSLFEKLENCCYEWLKATIYS